MEAQKTIPLLANCKFWERRKEKERKEERDLANKMDVDESETL